MRFVIATLRKTVALEFDTSYTIFLEADSESQGVNTVPEPSTLVLLSLGCIGLLLAGWAQTRRARRPVPRRVCSGVGAPLVLMLTLLLPPALAQAKYIGGEPAPKKGCACQSCSTCNEFSACGCALSTSEGTLREQVGVSSIKSTAGATLDVSLTYNSYNADTSHAQVDTVLGYGWTHSYNMFLFNQRGHMFRMDGTGRVTKYQRRSGGIFTPTTGYFETLVESPPGTFTLRQKDGITFIFTQVPNTPFLVAGPVYRLTHIRDRNNNTTTLTYTNGNLTSVTDTYGRSLTFSYDSRNKLVTVTDPLGRTTKFTYDTTGRKQ